MHAPTTPATAGFKRQIVVRIGQEDWPLLEAAVQQHGSIQAAVLAGLRALTPESGTTIAEASAKKEPAAESAPARPARQERPRKPRSRRRPASTAAVGDPDEEIPAREAAGLLGLETSTIKGYIRSGRLSGRYDEAPTWRGYLTTRAAVDAYRRTRGY